MGSLSGTFPFRPFILPFTAERGMSLENLAVNVVFPGRGTVVLERLALVELDSGDDFFVPAGAWLTSRQIALLGGIAGTCAGLLGALVGFLASRGRARGLVLAVLRGMLAAGVAALLVAAAGWWRAQPHELLFMLLLLGVICTVVPASLLGKVRRDYEERPG
jgi:hypothetical protein